MTTVVMWSTGEPRRTVVPVQFALTAQEVCAALTAHWIQVGHPTPMTGGTIIEIARQQLHQSGLRGIGRISLAGAPGMWATARAEMLKHWPALADEITERP